MNHSTKSRVSASSDPMRDHHPSASHTVAEEPPADSAGGFVTFIRILPLQVGMTIVIGLLSLTLATGVSLCMPDPTSKARLAAYLALAATALLGGICAGRLCPNYPVLSALGAGLVFALLLTLLSALVRALIPGPAIIPGAEAITPPVGQTVSTLQAVCMRLGVAALHPVAAYLTRKRRHEPTPRHTSPRRAKQHAPTAVHPSRHSTTHR